MIITINGKTIAPEEFCIRADDMAFTYGFGVFETMRTYGGEIFRLDDHLERLFGSAEIIGLKSKWKKEDVADFVKKLKTQNSNEVRIRVVLTVNDVIIYVSELEEKPVSYYKKGVKIVTYKGKRSIPEAKVIADTICYLANQYAKSKGVFESLFVDDKGYVRECSGANILWVKNGKLYTTKNDVLPGITRDIVMGLADKSCFKNIKLQELLKADEVFITQTSSGMLPVVSIDGKKIGKGAVGDVIKELMRRFSAFCS